MRDVPLARALIFAWRGKVIGRCLSAARTAGAPLSENESHAEHEHARDGQLEKNFYHGRTVHCHVCTRNYLAFILNSAELSRGANRW